MPRSGRICAVVLGLLLVCLITYNVKSSLIDVRFAKGQRIAGEEFVRWNEFSRIAMKKDPGGDMRNIFIDADASTGVARFDFEHLTPKQQFDLKYAGPGFPYLLRPGAKTLVIGPGGGWDVSRALASGSKDITGVEINPIIARVDHEGEIPSIQQSSVFPSRCTDRDRRRPLFRAPLAGALSSAAGDAGRHLGVHRRRSLRALGKQPVHHQRVPSTTCRISPPTDSCRSRAGASIRRANRCAWSRWPSMRSGNWARRIRRGMSLWCAENLQKLEGWGAQDTILVARKPFTADGYRVDRSSRRDRADGSRLCARHDP